MSSSTAISPGQASPGVPPPNDGRMRVYVRVRPVNQREASGNNRIVVEPVDENLVVFDPVDEEPQFYYKGKTYKEPGRKTSKNIQFTFDRVFDEESTNVEVYESVTKSLITGTCIFILSSRCEIMKRSPNLNYVVFEGKISGIV